MTEPTFRKSSFSVDNNCVEVADLGATVTVRNSQRPDAAPVEFTRAEFAAWLAGCKAGEFDDLV